MDPSGALALRIRFLTLDKRRDDLPGPGNYADENNTFGKAAKGTANMGSKYKPERNSNPGPG